MHKTSVIKSFGKVEPFSEQKLVLSLRKSGAGKEVIDSVVQEVIYHLRDGMTTREIYKQAFELLKQYSKPHAVQAAKRLSFAGYNKIETGKKISPLMVLANQFISPCVVPVREVLKVSIYGWWII